MDDSGRPVTVIEVTIRDEIGRLFDGSRGAPDRDDIADALRQAGIDDIDGSLVDAAIGHYAETASITEADALADVAMAASPIPFDPAIDHVGATDEADPPDEPDSAPSPDGHDGHDADPMDGLDAAEVDPPAGPELDDDRADHDDVSHDAPVDVLHDGPDDVSDDTSDDEFGRGAMEPAGFPDDLADRANAFTETGFDAIGDAAFDAAFDVELELSAELDDVLDPTPANAGDSAIDPDTVGHDASQDAGHDADADPSGFDGLDGLG